MAIVALVCVFACTPAALVFGLIGLNQIKRTGESGRGMAIAGIVLGGLSILAFVLLVGVAFAIGFGSSVSCTSVNGGPCV